MNGNKIKVNNKTIKKAYNDIIAVCNKYNNLGSDFYDIKDFIAKAKNHLLIVEWEEKYGIKLEKSATPYISEYVKINDFISFQYFKDAKKDKELGRGRYISWEDNGKQPNNEWLLVIGFPIGAYIFGDDYPIDFFNKFRAELKKYDPDFVDTTNKYLYWKLKNAKNIYNDFDKIYSKYKKLNEIEFKKRKLAKKEKEIERLRKELKNNN